MQVLAAASLSDAFRELAAVFERTHPGQRVELSFAGSQILRTQIEQGAPGDVFASAELEQAVALERAGLLREVQVFARNRIALVVPADGGRVSRLGDLGGSGVRLVVAGPDVPAGRYTRQVLERLAASGLFGDDFRERVLANVASHETNVRAVLAKVALGEADAGFVYRTDALGSSQVRMIEIPERHNVLAEYPIGLLGEGAPSAAAREFMDLVLGLEGQGVLRRHGFAR